MCAACMAGTCTEHGKADQRADVFLVPVAYIQEQRDRLITEIAARYGIRLHPGRTAEEILGSNTDIDDLETVVMADERLDAVGRGYYLGVGGMLDFVTVPAWTLDPASVAMARIAAIVTAPFRRAVRWLARRL